MNLQLQEGLTIREGLLAKTIHLAITNQELSINQVTTIITAGPVQQEHMTDLLLKVQIRGPKRIAHQEVHRA